MTFFFIALSCYVTFFFKHTSNFSPELSQVIFLNMNHPLSSLLLSIFVISQVGVFFRRLHTVLFSV